MYNSPRSIYQYFNMAQVMAQVKPLYLELFSLYPSLFWELRDKGNLKNLQFWPESLGAILEYWYIERGQLWQPSHTNDRINIAPDVSSQGMWSFG